MYCYKDNNIPRIISLGGGCHSYKLFYGPVGVFHLSVTLVVLRCGNPVVNRNGFARFEYSEKFRLDGCCLDP